MRRTTIIWLIAGTLCLLIATSSTQAQEPVASLNIVNVILKTNTIKIRTLRNTQVQIRLKDASGKLRARTESLIPAAGIQDVNLYTGNGSPAIIQPGDSVVVTPEGEEPVVIATVYLDVRPVTEIDTLFLEGPPNAELQVQVQVPDETFPWQFAIKTDAEGLATLTGVDLRPGVLGFVAYEPTAYRAIVVSFQVPTVVAKVGSDWIEGYIWAEREISLTLALSPAEGLALSPAEGLALSPAEVLEDDVGQPIAMTRLLADGEGYFSIHLAEEFAGLQIRPGQTIRIAWDDQAITLPVSELSIHADPESDQITGHGPPGADLAVTIYDQTTGQRQWYYPTVDQNGQYQVNLSGHVDISPNDYGSVIYETAEGHKLVAEFRVPFRAPTIELKVGSYRVSGRGVENASVVVDLQAGDGTIKATAQTTVGSSGRFAVELKADGQPVPVIAGDTVHITITWIGLSTGTSAGLSTDGDDQITIHVPTLTVHLDPDQERVTGQGLPGVPLQISLVAGDDWLTQEVTPDAAGDYSLDFGSQADIRAGALAIATYTTPDGHQISVQDRLTQITVQTGTNYITGVTDPDTVVDVFVRDADGQLKDRAQTTAGSDGDFAIDTTVIITSGNEIVVEAGEEDASLIIPNLTATLDPEFDQVTGTGPAGATVEVRLSAAGGARRDDITIGDDGRYRLTYAPDIDIRPGDHVTASFVNLEGHAVFVRANAPTFSVTIGRATLRGSIAPLASVHVALRDGQDVPKAEEATATSNRNGSFSLTLRDEAGQPVPIEADDRVEVTAGDETWHLRVPPLSLTLGLAAPQATGVTEPDAVVTLQLVSQTIGYTQYTVSSDANGRYVVAFDPDLTVQGPDWATASITTPDGLQVKASDFAPWITAQLGSHHAAVRVTPRASVTITLESADGALQATRMGRADSNGNYEAEFLTWDGQPVEIRTGDHITLEEEGAEQTTSMIVPHLTVEFDPWSHAVLGEGPAGATLAVSVSGTGGQPPLNRYRTVPVWSDGTYVARFAGLELGVGASASVSYADPGTGHRTIIQTTQRRPLYTVYLPLISR